MTQSMPLGKWNVHGLSMLMESLRLTLVPTRRLAPCCYKMYREGCGDRSVVTSSAVMKRWPCEMARVQGSTQEIAAKDPKTHRFCPATGCRRALDTAVSTYSDGQ